VSLYWGQALARLIVRRPGLSCRTDGMSPLARLIRCAIVTDGTRNALAISAAVRPPTCQNSKGYISRVTTLVTASAAPHTRLRLSQALRRIARPSLL
jgi:hypothetical protein